MGAHKPHEGEQKMIIVKIFQRSRIMMIPYLDLLILCQHEYSSRTDKSLSSSEMRAVLFALLFGSSAALAPSARLNRPRIVMGVDFDKV